MNKMSLFRMIGESYAQSMQSGDIIKRAPGFFQLLADEMYPINKHRREWAFSNMHMFFLHEAERREIMRALMQTKPTLLNNIRTPRV